MKTGASPLHFSNLCTTFNKIFEKIVSTSGGQSKHLLAGLEKLNGAK